jgi:hypothetical protein
MSVLGICSEVGGANQIIPYLLGTFPSFEVLAIGRAEKSARNYGVRYFSDLDQIVSKSLPDKLLIAPAPNAQIDEIYDFSIRCAGEGKSVELVMDNWVNFEKRFQLQAFTSVTTFDEYAYDYAKKLLNNKVPVSLKSNHYLKMLSKRFTPVAQENVSVLFLDSLSNTYTDYEAGDHGSYCKCEVFSGFLGSKFVKSFVYRSHPSAAKDLCLEKFVAHPKFRSSLEGAELIEDLNQANLVVGNPGYALYVSQSLGIPTYLSSPTNRHWHGPSFPFWSEVNLNG